MAQTLVQCVASMSIALDILKISVDRIKSLTQVEVAAIIDTQETMMTTLVIPDTY